MLLVEEAEVPEVVVDNGLEIRLQSSDKEEEHVVGQVEEDSSPSWKNDMDLFLRGGRVDFFSTGSEFARRRMRFKALKETILLLIECYKLS